MHACRTFLSTLLASLTLAGAALAAPQYRVTDLGTLGGPESDAMAINRRGVVVGFSNTPGVGSHYRAFSFRNGRMTDLGGLTAGNESFAKAVNLGGVACGSATAADFSGHAVVFAQGAVTDIHALRSDWLQSECTGINGQGQLIGTALSGEDYTYHAFVYANGSFTVLEAGTTGYAINDNGQYTGTASSSAFIADANGRTLLGDFGGGYSEAGALNNAGEVTGWAGTQGNGELHAFLWRQGTLTDLGTLGGWQSRGMAINKAGTIVGWSYTHQISGARGFIMLNGRMTDLNTLLDPVSGAGWQIYSASGIDDRGRITGTGTLNGFTHGYLLTPVGR